jgi:DNA invertase Pin-like site-specific DNA recombinase
VETLARVIAILSERRMGRVLRMKAKGALEQFAARLEAERTQREINAMVAEGMGYGDVTKNTR